MTPNSGSPFLSLNMEQLAFEAGKAIEPVEERMSVNFSMGAASHERTKFLHFLLVSPIYHVPGFTEAITGSYSLTLVSFAINVICFVCGQPSALLMMLPFCYIPTTLQCFSV